MSTDTNANRLRGYVSGELKTERKVSLVSVIAKFDFREHAIPTLEELNRALSGLGLVTVPSDDDVVLEKGQADMEEFRLSENDMTLIYESYLRRLRKARPNNA